VVRRNVTKGKRVDREHTVKVSLDQMGLGPKEDARSVDGRGGLRDDRGGGGRRDCRGS